MLFAKICGISIASTSLAVAGPVVAYLTKTNTPETSLERKTEGPSQPITISTEVADTTTGSGPLEGALKCYLGDDGSTVCSDEATE